MFSMNLIVKSANPRAIQYIGEPSVEIFPVEIFPVEILI